jgi:CRP-like cAMP-binding protein
LRGGAVVFDEGQPVRRFHLLLSGSIRFVRLTADGSQIIVLHISAGQMFGIGTALGQITHQVTAVTADDCVVLSWPNALWLTFSGAYLGFAAEALRTFGNRADEMSDRLVELSTKLVEQRIACALVRMIGQSGRVVPGGVEIGFPITRQNVADMTGTTLHTVSRLLSDWEKRGLVESRRCRIVVTDAARLSVMGGATPGMGGATPGMGVREPERRDGHHKPCFDAVAVAARNLMPTPALSRRYPSQARIAM